MEVGGQVTEEKNKRRRLRGLLREGDDEQDGTGQATGARGWLGALVLFCFAEWAWRQDQSGLAQSSGGGGRRHSLPCRPL